MPPSGPLLTAPEPSFGRGLSERAPADAVHSRVEAVNEAFGEEAGDDGAELAGRYTSAGAARRRDKTNTATPAIIRPTAAPSNADVRSRSPSSLTFVCSWVTLAM